MVDSIEFAKYIINRFLFLNIDKNGKTTLSETKLHKLMYICDGLLLSADINLIGENPKAWNYGPVYPRVNNWLKKKPDALEKRHDDISEDSPEIKDVIVLIDTVINSWGLWPAYKLSNWSHSPGSPWEKALKKGKGYMNSVIDKKDMGKYFQEMISGN